MNVPYVLREIRSHGLGFVLRRRGIHAGSRRAMMNSALNAYEERQGRTWLRSNPVYVQIEPTTACNLGCTMCGRQTAWDELRRNTRYLPWQVFMKTVPFLQTAKNVALHGWGESLVHPELPEMANVAKRAGAIVDLT
ncbi:MAG TPA: hypothetical protein VKU41_09095, partial [Polyangiaceae bacterium]|nr:hypothetical protein [Polyangiaceae bacterium]